MKTKTVLLLGAAALGVGWYLKNKAGEALESVGEAVNPVDRDNVFYSGVNEIGEAITGDTSFSLGAAIYELFK